MTTASTQPSRSLAADPLALIDVDHVRFYVGNAKQAAYFYAHTFGFHISQVWA
jgi:4-hydroxyphenylpyruvate dioxygenase